MAKRLRGDSLAGVGIDGLSSLVTSSSSVNVEVAGGHRPKYASLDSSKPAATTAMRCLLPPHQPIKFATYDEYETHYQQTHTNRCTECHRNFPTQHFLDLHLTEHHSPITAAKRERGEKTYACLVEGCEKVCGEWKKRRSHLVDKHGFPKNYDFFVVNHGVDGRRSMLRPGVDAEGHRRSSRERRGSATMDVPRAVGAVSPTDHSESEAETGSEEGSEDEVEASESKTTGGSAVKVVDSVDELTNSMSTLKMVPRSVQFGRRRGRTGFSKT